MIMADSVYRTIAARCAGLSQNGFPEIDEWANESASKPDIPRDGDEWEFWVDNDPDQPHSADCPVCGASGACSWDNEGRPLIHADPGGEE